MEKKDKITRAEIDAIEAIPRENRTLKDWLTIAKWNNQNLTPEQKKFVDGIVKQYDKAMAELMEEIGTRGLSPEDTNTAIVQYFQERAEVFAKETKALKEKEQKLKEDREKLEAEKLKLKEKQKGSYRRPRHLVEAINQRKPLEGELRTLFSGIVEEAISTGVKVPSIIGINLTRGERKLTNCFSIMLQQRSNTYDDKALDYYSGDNKNPSIVAYGTKVTAPRPELKFTHFELTKAYTNKEQPSGKDMRIVKDILDGLLSKTFLIEREVVYKNSKTGENIPYIFRGREPLIIIGERANKSDQSRDKSQDTVVVLNPLFVLQIRSFYVTYPADLDQRIEEAYGSKKVPEAVHIFIDYLATLRGVTNNYTHEIYKSTLYKKLNEKWLQESRLAKLEEGTLKAIEVAEKIGLLENWKEVDGSTGEKKYIFKTKKEWVKEN